MTTIRLLFIPSTLEHYGIFQKAKSHIEPKYPDIEVLIGHDLDQGIHLYQSSGYVYLVLLTLDSGGSLQEVLPKLRYFLRTPIFVIANGQMDELDLISIYQFGGEVCLQLDLSVEILVALITSYIQRVKTYLLQYPPFSAWGKEFARSANGLLVFDRHNMMINTERRAVLIKDKELHLTATEYNLLHYLALNADHVLTHGQLNEWLCRNECKTHFSVIMSRLKKKIPNANKILISVYGIGYCFSSR